MIRIMQPLLALIGLLLLALMAARADSAAWEVPDPILQLVPSDAAFAAGLDRPLVHRCLPPHRQQPETHLPAQPFAYGYFGARAQPTASYHVNARADWAQWSVRRAD